ncbi:MAG: Rrf2 family transcriptional regulator [Candidatus Omnitrophica bacterium]|nr:Rrf2 family transcriptional regulator [Candidatus Omnitrophota bacterium]MDD5352972.1 Rrf2 family transcriptional regulator [Candidatus Omnitrophota bacterium]MDD5550571.1 Rrf2 family transcriptional regulator [Candidatus Omnitrophota bacterium]
MQITYKGDYSLKAILYLAIQYNKDVVTINELAERLDIPVKFLEQILLELKRGGFVESKRGIKGGYYLAKQPKNIKLGDVVRFVDGPIEPIACANKNKPYKGCSDMQKCVFRNIWNKVSESISDIVDKVTFEDLCSKFKQQEQLNYYI